MKETDNSFSYEKFKKILKRLFVEPFKMAPFRATTKTKVDIYNSRLKPKMLTEMIVQHYLIIAYCLLHVSECKNSI